ncbi:MAG: YraN family protein [Flavobacteriales bacterium]|nr:YraN family protein [Flavobacteriales bacterium]
MGSLSERSGHLVIGRQGEQLACQFLIGKGLTVLERNWRSGRNEIDVIARESDRLVIVEVKARTSEDFGAPHDAIGPAKRKRLYAAAEDYLSSSKLDLPVRFDVISIVLDDGVEQIEHIEDAFYPDPDESEQ